MAKKAFVYDGTQWVDIAQSTADLSNYANLTTTPISGFRNAIINGGFDVWQRGTSGSGPGYSADRWRNNNPTSWVQSTDVPEPSFRYSMKGTGSSSQPLFRYHFETADAIKLAGKTQTLSVWIKATSGVPVIFGINTSTTVDNSSTGTWTDSVGQTTYTASGSWERKTMTVTFPSTVKSIRVQVGANANITGDLFFTGVQLEAGSIATPFEQRPVATELALCERYYVRFTAPTNSGVLAMGWQASTGASVFVIPLGTRMRIVPAPGGSGIVVSDETSYEATIFSLAIGVNGSDTKNISLTATHSTAGAQFRPASIRRSSGTAGFLDLSAEL